MSQPVIWFSFDYGGAFTDPDDIGAERDVKGEGTIGKAVLLQVGALLGAHRVWRVYFQSPLPDAEYVVNANVFIPEADGGGIAAGVAVKREAHYIDVDLNLVNNNPAFANVFIYNV